MPFTAIIDAERRKRIRTNLARHMKTDKVSAKQIAAFIKDRPQQFDGVEISEDSIKRFLDLKAGKVADIRVAVLEQYLEGRREIVHAAPPLHNNLLAGLFPAVRDFFHMRPEKADQHRGAIIGTYAFYAYSEKGRDRVCQGAIEFSVDPTGEFRIKEIQSSIPIGGNSPYFEIFAGSFIFRKNSLIAFLKDDEESRPKFYILSIVPYKNNSKHNLVMTGALLKIGAQKDVFIGNVYMIRRDTAFDECKMVDPLDIPSPIIAYLNSGVWAAD